VFCLLLVSSGREALVRSTFFSSELFLTSVLSSWAPPQVGSQARELTWCVIGRRVSPHTDAPSLSLLDCGPLTAGLHARRSHSRHGRSSTTAGEPFFPPIPPSLHLLLFLPGATPYPNWPLPVQFEDRSLAFSRLSYIRLRSFPQVFLLLLRDRGHPHSSSA